MARAEILSVLRRLGVTSEAVKAPPPAHLAKNFGSGASTWKVTLKRGSARLTTPFAMGSAHKGQPDIVDVVSSLVLDASSAGESFKDFADNFGYSDDSLTAKATWKAIETMAPKVKKFFGRDYPAVIEACADY